MKILISLNITISIISILLSLIWPPLVCLFVFPSVYSSILKSRFQETNRFILSIQYFLNFYFYVYLKLVPSKYINFLHNHSILFHFKHFFMKTWIRQCVSTILLPSVLFRTSWSKIKVGSYLFFFKLFMR